MRSKCSKKQASKSRSEHGKVGSDPSAIKKVGGKGDFGVRADDPTGRAYVSEETKLNDRGAAPSRIKIGDEARESGVGANESGTGSGSGGDVDTDIIGFDGAGLAASGPDRTEGPDITTTGGSEPFAARGPKADPNHKPPRVDKVHGSTVDHSGGDIATTGGGLDAGSASNPEAQQDGSFAADIQLDEAAGGDNAASDNR